MKKIISIVSSMAIVVSTLAIPLSVGAAAMTVGNDNNVRSNLDTYSNFVIIDTNHPATALGELTTFNYYASNTNTFRFILVDSANKVLWLSDEIAPAGTGAQIFTPGSPVVVHAGDNLGLYFKSTGTIPFESAGALAWYRSNNSDLPAVNVTLTYEGSSNRIYSFVATGATAAILPGTLSAEDFGVVNYDTGLGMLKGYTAGFGLTDATFAGVQSVVVKLYSGTTLLQTNTATSKVGTDITGTQISSPFDVSGTFNYVTDGYWTNVKEAQYGQSVPATKVVATVKLVNGKVVTAENTNLTGDPTTIYPAAPVTSWIDAKWGVMIDMDTLLATAITTRHDQVVIADAIEHIKLSVRTSLWSDASHLYSKKGSKVFDQEEEAVNRLKQLMKDKKSMVSDATLQGFIDRLIAIDRGLALTQITDAIAQDGRASEIAKANTQLGQGDAAASLGKTTQAINNYKSAWNHAVKSLE